VAAPVDGGDGEPPAANTVALPTRVAHNAMPTQLARTFLQVDLPIRRPFANALH
jgi:hypothetical protein